MGRQMVFLSVSWVANYQTLRTTASAATQVLSSINFWMKIW